MSFKTQMAAWLAIGLGVGGATAADEATGLQIAQQGQQWTLENAKLQMTIDAQNGAFAVRDKAAGYQWKADNPDLRTIVTAPRLHDVRRCEGPEPGVVFEMDFGGKQGKTHVVSVTIAMHPQRPEVSITADMKDRAAEIPPLDFLGPLVLDTPSGVYLVSDYCDGHMYPLDEKPFPRGAGLSANRLDMPWVGVCDVEKGFGYMLLLETPDDAFVAHRTLKVGDRERIAPQVRWLPSKKTFAYARRMTYHFASQGGHVALAKAYRRYAQEHGLVVTFAEKVKKNPNIERLFGAPDVWAFDNATLSFAKEAKAAGVEKMLLHGRSSADDMKAINALGYLTSEYDNYTDVLPLEPGKEVSSNRDHIPECVVLRSDGTRMNAWLTFDKKQQFMKRCPAQWVEAAKQVIPKALEARPFLGRFIDVTTAEGLYECFDASHPLSHTQKRECGPALLGYVRSLGLVVGGEHGIWWAVPHLDYIEGMMSSNPHFSWPAGHLIRPKGKDQDFTSPWGHKLPAWDVYEKYGIGHAHRVPLWELVFHDCVVSTWYWGDASDFLLAAAPEITAKKDAFNVLYGTTPMLWATKKEGSWGSARDVFLRTYRNTCKFHEVVAAQEMLSHEFLTPDRAVQRTRFADGTEAVVNFGPQPFTAQVGGKSYLLPQNGWAAKRPRIEQSRAVVDGKTVTTIRTAGYQYSGGE